MIDWQNIKTVQTITVMNRHWLRMFCGWLVFFMVAVPMFGQDVTMELFPIDNPHTISRLDWGQQLFWVRVTNNEDTPIQYRIVYRLQISNSPLISGTIMTGRTRVGTKQWDGENSQGYLAPNSGENVYNNDFSRIDQLVVDPGFNAIVARAGTLPSGDYELRVELQAKLWSDDDELYFTDPPPVETIYHEWRITIPVPPLLYFPSDESAINQTNPTFSWYSVQTAPGTQFLYNIRICLVEEGQSREEAMENLTHWTNDWDIDYAHLGGQENISWTYPPEADPFAMGREYVWQVSTYNEGGLYGWDVFEPAVSEIWSFKFGESPELLSPGQGGIEPGVRPSFTWAPVIGAMNYELRIGDRDDPFVELPIWDAVLTDASYLYPIDAPSLVPLPSYPYYWKIRANPLEPIPGEWSEIFQFTISPIELTEPQAGTSISTVLPKFDWSTPGEFGGYEIRISHGDADPVTSPIFSQVFELVSFEYPADAISLVPGKTYNWIVIAFDQDENILGTAEDYTGVSSFIVDPVILFDPPAGSSVNSLIPTFSWDVPTGISGFEFQISSEEDPGLANPGYTYPVSKDNYQLNASEYLLELGRTYFWRVIPLDPNGIIMGNIDEYLPSDFVVENLDTTVPVVTVSINDETPNMPTVSLVSGVEDADGYALTISTVEDVVWESPVISTFPYTPTSDDMSFAFNTEYNIKAQAYKNDEPLGEMSAVFTFTTGSEPGPMEQLDEEIELIIDFGD